MIKLLTGSPGAGKSLLAVELILENSRSDSPRALFSNINGLDFDGLRCFPLESAIDWHNLPDGSIIVIDECQQHFPPRPSGSKVPPYISAFETHRHKGHDVILITQHPNLIDQNIRRLVDHHIHAYRPFGFKHRVLFEWNGCNLDPEPAKSESNALKKKKKFDSNLFKFYKSASVHTDKARPPYKKIITLFCALIVVFVFSAVALHRMSAPIRDAEAKKEHVQSQLPNTGELQETDELPEFIAVGRVGSVFYLKQGSSLIPHTSFSGFEVSGPSVFVLLNDKKVGRVQSQAFANFLIY